VVVRALVTADLAMGAGRTEEARRILDRVRALDPGNQRLAGLEADLQRSALEKRQADARRTDLARAPRPPATARGMGPAFQKEITLEFRDAPLRQVFESLARTSGINFVFDKDVRGETRITTFLRGVTLDEGMKVVLASQQLDRKLLNENTVLVYPNTPAKQREHQELVTRTLYLTNTDAKTALTLVRTMAKTRDVHVDERLNALVVRDTVEVVALIEKLLGTVDLADPEVSMAVEVIEVGSTLIDDLGISWPREVDFGLPGATGAVPLNSTGGFRGSIASPALIAQLRSQINNSNLLANPSVRARNHEKAKVQIGEKLPVFSTTAASVSTGASTSVSQLDVGLKVELEPSIQLDGEVTIKISLEVSNLLNTVGGPNGSVGYQLGTRMATTSLRLRDGETQVLSGLIKDEDRKALDGLPGLVKIPLLGRLFGTNKDDRQKTEIIMLITPRIVRNLPLPDVDSATLASGTDALPGAQTLQLRPRASVGVGAGAGGPARPSAPATEASEPPSEPAGALLISSTTEAAVGETVSVTLANRTGNLIKGDLEVDPTMLQLAGGGQAVGGRVSFLAAARQDAVLIFRVLPPAAGNELRATITSANGADAQGNPVGIPIEGNAVVRIKPKAAGTP
jgi:general secretion pathway protein D